MNKHTHQNMLTVDVIKRRLVAKANAHVYNRITLGGVLQVNFQFESRSNTVYLQESEPKV